MKATGIVRRIDDLGRVVIPKEIRRKMGATEGAPLEIFVTDDGGVVFKRYIPISNIAERCEDMEKALDDISEDLEPEKVVAIRSHLSRLKELCKSS